MINPSLTLWIGVYIPVKNIFLIAYVTSYRWTCRNVYFCSRSGYSLTQQACRDTGYRFSRSLPKHARLSFLIAKCLVKEQSLPKIKSWSYPDSVSNPWPPIYEACFLLQYIAKPNSLNKLWKWIDILLYTVLSLTTEAVSEWLGLCMMNEVVGWSNQDWSYQLLQNSIEIVKSFHVYLLPNTKATPNTVRNCEHLQSKRDNLRWYLFCLLLFCFSFVNSTNS